MYSSFVILINFIITNGMLESSRPLKRWYPIITLHDFTAQKTST